MRLRSVGDVQRWAATADHVRAVAGDLRHPKRTLRVRAKVDSQWRCDGKSGCVVHVLGVVETAYVGSVRDYR